MDYDSMAPAEATARHRAALASGWLLSRQAPRFMEFSMQRARLARRQRRTYITTLIKQGDYCGREFIESAAQANQEGVSGIGGVWPPPFVEASVRHRDHALARLLLRLFNVWAR